MIVDFNAKLKEKRENEATKRHKELFREIIEHATASEKDGIFEAVHNLDHEKYFELTQPIIMRIAMIKANRGEI